MTIILICITATNSKQVSFLHPSLLQPGRVLGMGLLLPPSALTQDLGFGITFVPKCTDPGFGIWDYFCPQVH